MTRIVGGVAGGRRLAVAPGPSTRPTSARAREGLFSTLATITELAGSRVLDLYAGSGALGLEALSRGAEAATLIECDPVALRVLRANVDSLALPGADIRAGRVEPVLAVGPVSDGAASAAGRYDVVLADPPYALLVAALQTVLTLLVKQGWLTTGAVLMVERSSRDDPLVWPAGIESLRHRRYGEATLWYGRAAPPALHPTESSMSRTDRPDAR